MIEQDTRFIIDNNLVNKSWILDINNPKKNVFFESDILRIIDNPKLKKLKKRPDYVLIDNNRKPIAIIEAKAGGKDLEKALDQAMDYSEILGAPLIFAMNNSYCQTKHLYTNKPLFINENEVNELIRQKEAQKFIEENTNSIYTIPKNVIISRKELIGLFKNLNNSLRAEGLRAGIERLSEFANILFLKLYTENNSDKIWNNLKNVELELLIDNFKSSQRLIEKKYNASVFSETQIKDPYTLRDIINKLDKLQLSTIDTDIKGDSFEYFLKQATATNNDLGEYFTPRHIVKTMINLINPKFKETIYDPFCGTGGFLTEAFNHIKDNTIINSNEDKLRLRKNTIYGRELTTNARLAKMNMILHGDGHSGVSRMDSLKTPVDGKYDVVVTNMPFSQEITKKIWNNETNSEEEKNIVSPLYYNSLGKKDGDAICILHCFKATKKGGRLAIVVPEGFLFNKKYKPVRKFLLEHSKLQTIISLPNGVFLPYTNVKTDILYFTNCHTKSTNDTIWYYDAKSDGFSLDNYREKIIDNDLKNVKYVNFKNNTDENIKNLGFSILNYNQIKNNDYCLVYAKYKNTEFNSKFKTYRIGDVIELKRGPFGSSIKKSVCVDKGYKLYEQSNVIKNNFTLGNYYLTEEKFQELKKFEIKENDILLTCAGTLGKIALVPPNIEKGIINSVLMRFRIINTNMILPEYLKYVLESNKIQNEMLNKSIGAAIKNMRPGKEIKNLFIPVPPIPIQQEIINTIHKNQVFIQKAQKEILDHEAQIDCLINSIWND